jgi:hypothetical protein
MIIEVIHYIIINLEIDLFSLSCKKVSIPEEAITTRNQ